jgi:hypothetical protein
VSGVGLDKVVGIDVLDDARGRDRHPAVVLPLAASAALLKEEVRCALLRLWGARVLRRSSSGVAAEGYLYG